MPLPLFSRPVWVDPSAAVKTALRHLARRHAALSAEIAELDHDLSFLNGKVSGVTTGLHAASNEDVVVAGGDGTVGDVARALVGTDVTLGILPFGTFMNIARALEIPRDDPRAAAEIIAGSAARPIDVGAVGGHLFLEAAGVGLDADMLTAGRALQHGERGLAVAAIGALLRRRGARVRIDVDGRTHTHRVLQAVVCNGPWYGWGFSVAPDAAIDDGLLDLVIFGDSRWQVLRDVVAAAIHHDRPARARRYRGKRITLSATRELAVHADAQVVGNLPQTFTVRPNALKVFAPRPG